MCLPRYFMNSRGRGLKIGYVREVTLDFFLSANPFFLYRKILLVSSILEMTLYFMNSITKSLHLLFWQQLGTRMSIIRRETVT